jgi:hypothetical protein
MPTRRTEPSHEGDQAPRDAASGVESPSADQMQGANGPLHRPDGDDDTSPAGDQDIDTAGTDADDQSPTKAIGTGIAPPRSRG